MPAKAEIAPTRMNIFPSRSGIMNLLYNLSIEYDIAFIISPYRDSIAPDRIIINPTKSKTFLIISITNNP